MQTRFRKNPISLSVQLENLYIIFPNSKGKINRSCLKCECKLKPTEMSEIYTIKLEYKISKKPKVNVIEPNLVIPSKKMEIHMFSDESLCLYYYKFNDWDKTMLLSDTIIPWTSAWLFYYEIWKVTGKWHGGGIHPQKKAYND